MTPIPVSPAGTVVPRLAGGDAPGERYEARIEVAGTEVAGIEGSRTEEARTEEAWTERSGTDGPGTDDALLSDLRAVLRGLGEVVVAFSGGADSAFLAWVAHDTLGPAAVAVTAVSPSLAPDERADCAALATEWGLDWHEVLTREMDDERYRANDADRCAWCKTALMDALGPWTALDGATVVLGVNLDDLGDHRPGQHAAAERGAVFPLVEAGFTKADVRRLSRHLGLRTWDKPAAACLASRIPYGTPVALTILDRVGRAEAGLHRLGLRDVRVRHYEDTARIEVPLELLGEVVVRREAVIDAVQAAGYRRVTLDLEGLRSGNLNSDLAPDAD